MERAIVAELQEVVRIQLGEQVKVPGEGRVKSHTWRVTKAYRAKSVAGSALKRCRRGPTLQEMQACKAKHKEASRRWYFTKAYSTS